MRTPVLDPRPPVFDETFRERLREVVRWRRDVRRFRTEPLAAGLMDGLIETACLAPSVGLSQPWRFVLVQDASRRQAVVDDFKRCNREALDAYQGEDAALYARLKLAGLGEAPVHLAVFADEAEARGRGLGRRTMPETLHYSVVTAISTLWLAARAEGVGMGWVSILDPAAVVQILDVPQSWRLIGYFCLGYPEEEMDIPELDRAGWERRRPTREFIVHR